MRTRRFIQRQDGEEFEVPVDEPYRLACCDCGLVHDCEFRLRDGRIFLAASRNNRSTAQRRRHKHD